MVAFYMALGLIFLPAFWFFLWPNRCSLPLSANSHGIIISLQKHRGEGPQLSNPFPQFPIPISTFRSSASAMSLPQLLSFETHACDEWCTFLSASPTAHHPPHARGFHHGPLLSAWTLPSPRPLR